MDEGIELMDGGGEKKDKENRATDDKRSTGSENVAGPSRIADSSSDSDAPADSGSSGSGSDSNGSGSGGDNGGDQPPTEGSSNVEDEDVADEEEEEEEEDELVTKQLVTFPFSRQIRTAQLVHKVKTGCHLRL